jgi:twitching motility protein PilT
VYTADVSHIEVYLNELMERRATDLHIAAGSHPMIRIDGSLQPIKGSEPLTPEQTTMIIDRLVGPHDLDRFNQDRQLDFSFPWADRARFRANAYYQRNSPAVALRLIPTEIPHPTVGPAGKRSLRPTLCWRPAPPARQSTPGAAMVAGSPPPGPHPHHRGSHRVHAGYKMALVKSEVGTDVPRLGYGTGDPAWSGGGSVWTIASPPWPRPATCSHLHTNDAAQTVDRLIDVFPTTSRPRSVPSCRCRWWR